MKRKMKNILFYVIAIACTFSAKAQVGEARWDLEKYVWSHTHYQTGKNDKPVLDFEALDNWEGFKTHDIPVISRNGAYFAYQVERGIKNYKKDDSLIIQSTENGWRESFAGGKPGIFSADSKQYIFQDKSGRLCYLSLGKTELRNIEGVASYKTNDKGKAEWLAYQLKDEDHTTVVQNLLSGKEKRYKGIKSYSFDESGQWLVLNNGSNLILNNLATGKELLYEDVRDNAISSNGHALLLKTSNNVIKYVALSTGQLQTIWEPVVQGSIPVSYSMDKAGKQAVLVIADKTKSNTIWYWRKGMEKAVEKVNGQTAGMDAGLIIQGGTSFTENGRYIQFSLQPVVVPVQASKDAVQVDVWSYQDKILQSTQAEMQKESVSYLAIFNLEADRVLRLGNENENIEIWQEDFAVLKKAGRTMIRIGNEWEKGDRFWERDYWKDSNWVISYRDAGRHLLPSRGGMATFWFSPGGKYMVYFDGEQGCNYFSYELSTGRLVNISAGVPANQLGFVDAFLRTKEKPTRPVGVGGWLAGDEAVLVYDNYDIWQLDLAGKKPPVNITNGYGKANQTLFSLMGSERGVPWCKLVLAAGENIVLRAFNWQTKYNGYYGLVLGQPGDPALKYMGPCFMEGMAGITGFGNDMHPLKAAEADTWIVKRQTATDAPNYFLTHDFAAYKRLTNLQPQKGYNWLTTELVHFKQLDGTMSKGVLYKPENFDPSKKYPVIISFYSKLSDQLYQYPTPDYISAADIFGDPAWMVSHGYLVLVPDIYFTKGQWGPSTVNTMDGAARYLNGLPYVIANHIGAAGHSNSGRFGYYLLTHSKSFAAMSIGAGATDMLAACLSSQDFLYWGEEESLGSGLGNLWKNKSTWLDHTTVLQANHVISPLLMFHNKKDNAFGPGAAIELYISLRRLEKPCWWLQYDKGGHRLWEKNELRDYTTRYTQFFDHYLKGAPAPKWMCEGIPAKNKGLASKFDLTTEKSCGKDCPVCKKNPLTSLKK